jgi:hypothetical protein
MNTLLRIPNWAELDDCIADALAYRLVSGTASPIPDDPSVSTSLILRSTTDEL